MRVSPLLEHSFLKESGISPTELFPEENRFYLSGTSSSENPWEKGEETVKAIIKEWKLLENKLTESFRKRNRKQINPFMIRGIGLFLKLLFWSNGLPVCLKDLDKELEKMEILPVNIKDRLDFLLDHPLIYPSFIQLSALFIEQQKAYYKQMAMKRVNR